MKRQKCSGKNKCPVCRARRIDQMIQTAAERLGGLLRLFELAHQSRFGRLFNAEAALVAYKRYVEKSSLAQWVRQFVVKGLYMKIPV